jgi:anti-anti-sigma regulatory factor
MAFNTEPDMICTEKIGCFSKGGQMAANFSIYVTKTSDSVHLKLNGDFDGSSACELLNLLKHGALNGTSKILVDTDSLKHVHPFGLNIWRNRLHEVKSTKIPLIFTGRISTQFESR